MSARSKIIDLNRTPSEPEAEQDQSLIGGGVPEDGQPFDYADVVTDEQSSDWEDCPDTPKRNWGLIFTAAILISAFAGWTGFFAWTHWADIAALPVPARISELIVAWSVPTALIALVWLLAMRLSSREANRFGDVARLLREESLSLEERMRRVNGEISLARSFLAENARELESVGRMSAQRLTEAAETLGTALSDSDERAKMLQVASTAAVTNLEQLRNHLPVVTSAAKDATNQIGIAGNTAHGQIQAILVTLGQVNDASAKTGDELGRLDQQIGSAATLLEGRISHSAEKLAAAVETSREKALPLFADLDRHLSDVESRLAAATTTTGAQLDDHESRLTTILSALQAKIDQLQQTLNEQDSAAQQSVSRLNALIEDSRANLSSIDDEATDRIAKLAFAVNALVEKNDELTGKLAEGRRQTEDYIGQSTQLLQLLGELETEAGTSVPSAFAKLREKFETGQSAMAALNNEILSADGLSRNLAERIASLDSMLAGQNAAIEQLSLDASTHLGNRHEQIDALSAALNHTRGLVEEMSSTANDDLVSSLLRVRETTRQAAEASRKIIDEELSEIAGTITQRNQDALRAAVEEQVRTVDTAMREALQRNITVADEIEQRTQSQLERLDEMASNLEQRIALAHSSFSGMDDEGFARRMALLTESLNSAAIDVAKILSNEVTDTAWAAYLKGDRGVFTRRAVKLLDSSEAKIIATHYDDDAEFRDNVNRYIHDFEAMMRVLLSTRDGNAIGVTLLSSDVGKLYVALAQAIERLRS